MTPQLMQAIKLLQLSNLDLVSYVEAELERNPAAGSRQRCGSPVRSARRPPPEPDHTRAMDGEAWAEGATVADHPADHPNDDRPRSPLDDAAGG